MAATRAADTVGVDLSGATSTASAASGARWRSDPGALVPLFAAVAALAVLVANAAGIATGDDGVGYRAIADSLLAGNGYGYFLEDPVTVWPPVWPALMAAVAWLTPLTTLGAAIVLNAAVAAGVVVVGNRLLRVLVDDPRIVLAGTAVLALGPSTIGLGHVLMTDMAFALVMMIWMLTLLRFRRTGSLAVLMGAALLAWVGFGLRYVGLVLIAFGGLWLLLDARRGIVERVRNAAVYGAVAVIAPIAWMLRNNSIDGTFTGERNPSARGLVDNGFDVAATLGTFPAAGARQRADQDLGGGRHRGAPGRHVAVLAGPAHSARGPVHPRRARRRGRTGGTRGVTLATGCSRHGRPSAGSSLWRVGRSACWRPSRCSTRSTCSTCGRRPL